MSSFTSLSFISYKMFSEKKKEKKNNHFYSLLFLRERARERYALVFYNSFIQPQLISRHLTLNFSMNCDVTFCTLHDWRSHHDVTVSLELVDWTTDHGPRTTDHALLFLESPFSMVRESCNLVVLARCLLTSRRFINLFYNCGDGLVTNLCGVTCWPAS